MAIKAFCDICEKEIDSKEAVGFQFEATTSEIVTDLKTGQKTIKKDMVQVCKKCYNITLKHLLYGNTKK